MFRKFVREPLVHFLFGGFLLFVYFKSCGNSQDLFSEAIHVNKESVLNYYQFQSRAFNNDLFESKFDNIPEEEKTKIINSFIRDEVLFREAVKLGLDQNDFVIKRRIIQKMEFILDDFDKSNIQISIDSLRAYYDKYQERYFDSDRFTFTHIFFKLENDTKESALAKASSFMSNKRNQQLSIEESLKYGDRFLYHRNYIDKDEIYLVEQFGKQFYNKLMNLEANEDIWQGPFLSDHGYHWIKLVNKSNSGFQDFEDISLIVKEDYIIDLKNKHKEKRIRALSEDYKVVKVPFE